MEDIGWFGALMANYGMVICYILLACTVLAAIGGWGFQIIKDPQGIKGALIGIVVLAVVVGIGYTMADSNNPSNIEITESGAKMVGTGLFAFYILAIAAVVATLFSEVSKIFK